MRGSPVFYRNRRSHRPPSTNRLRRAACSLLIVLLAASALPAQNASSANATGKNDEVTTQLAGRVVSSAGMAVAGANVAVENLETHKRDQVATTSGGVFHSFCLPGNTACLSRLLDTRASVFHNYPWSSVIRQKPMLCWSPAMR